MIAIVIHERGGPEQFVCEQVPDPRPKKGEVLVRVHAAGVTPTELTWETTYRTRDGASRLPSIPGHELSGVVQVAADGSNFATGDAVYGLIDFWRNGDFAEFVTVAANDLAPKPQNVDHEHAAAAAMSALAAWQALFDYAALAEGHRILIHGAAGGVGSFAVQFAHWCGAHVLATAAAKHREFVLDLGAHEVIDYTAQRFEDVVRDVDVVLDLIGGDTLTRSWGVLQPGGILITLAGTIDLSEASRRRVRGVRFTVKPSRTDLAAIARLIDAGTIRSIVSDVFPLACAQKAFRQGLMGHNRGKIVLRVEGGHSGRG